jgi:hypothetical protein
MMHSDDGDDDDDVVQVIRHVRKNRIAHITTHQDPSGKNIVLWDDVLRVFPEALYLQRGKRVLPFLKGSDFKE